MTLAKSDLFGRFLDGGTSGKASREEIRDIDGLRSIVGYGWAIYIADLGDRYALFGDGYKTTKTNVGWAGYSGQTTQHLQEIKGALEELDEEYVVVDYQLTVNEVKRGEVDVEEIVEEKEVEPRKTTGYLYRQ